MLQQVENLSLELEQVPSPRSEYVSKEVELKFVISGTPQIMNKFVDSLTAPDTASSEKLEMLDTVLLHHVNHINIEEASQDPMINGRYREKVTRPDSKVFPNLYKEAFHNNMRQMIDEIDALNKKIDTEKNSAASATKDRRVQLTEKHAITKIDELIDRHIDISIVEDSEPETTTDFGDDPAEVIAREINRRPVNIYATYNPDLNENLSSYTQKLPVLRADS